MSCCSDARISFPRWRGKVPKADGGNACDAAASLLLPSLSFPFRLSAVCVTTSLFFSARLARAIHGAAAGGRNPLRPPCEPDRPARTAAQGPLESPASTTAIVASTEARSNDLLRSFTRAGSVPNGVPGTQRADAGQARRVACSGRAGDNPPSGVARRDALRYSRPTLASSVTRAGSAPSGAPRTMRARDLKQKSSVVPPCLRRALLPSQAGDSAIGRRRAAP